MNLSPDWQPGQLKANRIGGAVDLWCLPLEQIRPEPGLLNQTELAKAEARLMPEARRATLALRTALRRILASYLDMAPETLVFSYSDKGKPSLAGQQLKFNLSDSRNMAVLAVSAHKELGVDLEWPRPVARMEAIAQRFFDPATVSHIASLTDPALKEAAFTKAWVYLEARQKLNGEGLFGKRLELPHQLWLYGLDDGGFIALAQAGANSQTPRLWRYPGLIP